MPKEKKKWTTPQLIVLVREKLEEHALTCCKMAGTGCGSAGRLNFCTVNPPCDACSAAGQS